MKEKRVWRYYCDYCKKSGCNKYAIEQHELHCTMNPERQCRMCDIIGNEQKPISELKQLLPSPTVKENDWGESAYIIDGSLLENLRDATNNCPACILATIRQSGFQTGMYEFSFEKECQKFWDEQNNIGERWYE